MLQRGEVNFLLLVEFPHSIQNIHLYDISLLCSSFEALLIPWFSLTSSHFGKDKEQESQIFKIVGADADTKILLVSGVKLAAVVTTSFEHKKLSHITS